MLNKYDEICGNERDETCLGLVAMTSVPGDIYHKLLRFQDLFGNPFALEKVLPKEQKSVFMFLQSVRKKEYCEDADETALYGAIKGVIHSILFGSLDKKLFGTEPCLEALKSSKCSLSLKAKCHPPGIDSTLP